MKRFLICLVLILHATALPLSARDNLIIATVPWRDSKTLNEIYEPLISLLEQELKQKVRFVITETYAELGLRLDLKAADIGIFGANSYVEAKARYPGIQYLATAMQPTDHYNSLIIVHRKSGIMKLHELRGKSFGFTDKGSTSGYVYPLLMMRREGIDGHRYFQRIYFLKKHDKVYDAIARRSIDAGGVSSTALPRAVRRNGDIFRIISRSAPIPRTAFVVGAHIEQTMFIRIQYILSQAEASPFFKQSKSILKGFSIKDDGFYDIVREAKKIRK